MEVTSTKAAERADTARSEELASVCLPLWFSSVMPGTLDSPLIERILGRLEEFAACECRRVA